MKVIDLRIHATESFFYFVPRVKGATFGNVTLAITNETTKKEIANTVLSFSEADGLAFIEFDHAGLISLKERFSIKITNETTSEIIYRGKAICTDQDTEDYLITKDLFYYA